jgi:CobQ-like glutamine amidotransferase family enzyme
MLTSYAHVAGFACFGGAGFENHGGRTTIFGDAHPASINENSSGNNMMFHTSGGAITIHNDQIVYQT